MLTSRSRRAHGAFQFQKYPILIVGQKKQENTYQKSIHPHLLFELECPYEYGALGLVHVHVHVRASMVWITTKYSQSYSSLNSMQTFVHDSQGLTQVTAILDNISKQARMELCIVKSNLESNINVLIVAKSNTHRKPFQNMATPLHQFDLALCKEIPSQKHVSEVGQKED